MSWAKVLKKHWWWTTRLNQRGWTKVAHKQGLRKRGRDKAKNDCIVFFKGIAIGVRWCLASFIPIIVSSYAVIYKRKQCEVFRRLHLMWGEINMPIKEKWRWCYLSIYIKSSLHRSTTYTTWQTKFDIQSNFIIMHNFFFLYRSHLSFTILIFI